MADILIRNITDSDKRALEKLAQKNGRSQQAEALAILHAGLRRERKRDWVDILTSARYATGGIQMDLPERHAARIIETDGWQ